VEDILALLSTPAPEPPGERSESISSVGMIEPGVKGSAPPGGSSPEGKIHAARVLLALGEHEGVERLLTGEPGEEAALIVASSLIASGRGKEAYRTLQGLPPSEDVIRGRISALILMKDWRTVLEEVDHLPDSLEKKIIRVISLAHLKRYDDALHLARSLPETPLFKALCGVILHQSGRLDEALEIYDSAVSEEPTLFFAWHNMGIIYLQKGREEYVDVCLENAREIWKTYLITSE